VLGDDHVRLDLQARDDGRLQPFRRRLHFLHHAVNAVAQAESFFQRLQVDVRCAQLEGVHDDLVHQPDERRIGVHRRAVVVRLADLHLAQRQFLDHVLERAVGQRLFFRAIILVQRRLDVRLRRHAQFNLRAQQVRQRINRVQVGRVGDGHRHLVVGFEQGQDAVFLGDVAGDDGDDVILDFHRAEIDDFRAELRGLGLCHIRRADGLVRDQVIYHAHAAGFGARPGDHVGIGEAEVNQQIQKIIVFFCHDDIGATLLRCSWSAPESFHSERGKVNAE
jgi:hypothetical protein